MRPKAKSYLSFVVRQSLLILICFGLADQGAAQSPNKWLLKAEAARLDKSIPKAIEYYEWAQRKENNLQASIGLGLCYRELRKPSKAVKHFSAAADFDNPPSEVYFYLSQCQQSLGDPGKAQQWFDKYTQTSKDTDEDAMYWEMFERSGMEADLDSNRLIITKFKHNTLASDFSAVPWKDKIVFCSSRKSAASIIHISTIDNAPLVDLYTVPQSNDSTTRFKFPEPISQLNSRFNEGPICFSKDENRIYFTRNNINGRSIKRKGNKLNRLRIYQSDWVDGQWTEPVDLPFNNDGYANGHPSLSPDGRYLFYASDMPGGFGGTDLYKIEILGNGEFGNPINLGSAVNTKGDELFPYVHTDGMLFFASDYHVGYGGFDIFKSIPVESFWSAPINMGDPMNSEADDFGFWMYPNQRKGYFASDRRNEEGNDDIYEFTYDRPPFVCVPQEKNSYCYRFRDVGGFDIETDSAATVVYEWTFSDGGKEYGPVVKHCFPGAGDYLVQLNLIDTISGFVFMNKENYDVSLKDIEQVFIDCPDTILLGETITLNGEKSIFEDVEIQEYEWEIDALTISNEVAIAYKFTQLGSIEIKLGVSGYQPGNPKEKRGCAIKEVLVIDSERAQEIQDSIRLDKAQEIAARERWARYTDSLRQFKPLESADGELPKSGTPDAYSAEVYDSRGEPNVENPSPDLTPLSSKLDINANQFTRSITLTQPSKDGMPPLQLKVPALMNGKDLKILIRNTPIWRPGMPDFLTADPTESEKGYTLTTDPETNRLSLQTFDPLDVLLNPECEDCLPVSNYELFPGVKDLTYEVIEFKPLSAIIEKGLVVRINNIYFDFDSYELKSRYTPSLDRMLKLLIKYPNTIVDIMGHTDSDGSDYYNEVLSRNRALSISKYFAMQGLGNQRFKITGLGETEPVNSNATPYGRQLNRRVEFRFNPLQASGR